jgi:L-rhamnose mutarotase
VATVAAGLLVAGHLAFCVAALGQPAPVMVDEFPYQEQWRDVCQWIARSTIPRNARFLTPRTAQTFKWQTGRAEVANWKDVPQDARSLVEWWRRMNTLYASGMLPPEEPWQQSLLENDAETLLEMGRRYQADYLVDFASQPLALELLYENDAYAVYRLGK